MANDWKAYKSSTPAGCTCGDAAELHMFFVPKLGVALVALPILAIGKGGEELALASLAGAGALIALLAAVYAHLHCGRCSKVARPEGGKEKSMLALIRIGALLAAVILGIVTYYAVSKLRPPGADAVEVRP